MSLARITLSSTSLYFHTASHSEAYMKQFVAMGTWMLEQCLWKGFSNGNLIKKERQNCWGIYIKECLRMPRKQREFASCSVLSLTCCSCVMRSGCMGMPKPFVFSWHANCHNKPDVSSVNAEFNNHTHLKWFCNVQHDTVFTHITASHEFQSGKGVTMR